MIDPADRKLSVSRQGAGGGAAQEALMRDTGYWMLAQLYNQTSGILCSGITVMFSVSR